MRTRRVTLMDSITWGCSLLPVLPVLPVLPELPVLLVLLLLLLRRRRQHVGAALPGPHPQWLTQAWKNQWFHSNSKSGGLATKRSLPMTSCDSGHLYFLQLAGLL